MERRVQENFFWFSTSFCRIIREKFASRNFFLNFPHIICKNVSLFVFYPSERHASPQYIMRKFLTFHSINSGKFPLFHEKRNQSKIRKYLHMFIWGLWGVDSWKNQDKKSSAIVPLDTIL